MSARNGLAFAVSVDDDRSGGAGAGIRRSKGQECLRSGDEPRRFHARQRLEMGRPRPQGCSRVRIADLRGDHATGAFSAFLRLPPGFAVPLHTHTHEMRVVFLSGTYVQAPEGKPEVRLGPGSYMVQPGGNYRHTTSCDKASECVFYLESNGAFDLHPVAEGTAPAKK
jgi:Domain of unknown function (DUF4437)